MSNSSRKRYISVNSLTHLPPRSQPSITFSDVDFSVCDPNQDDSVVVTATIANWRVHKVVVDQGSSADVLYWSTFLKLNIPVSAVQPYAEPLLGFAGQRVHARGFVDLLTTFEAGQAYRTLVVRYILIDADTSYNVLIGIRTLNQLEAIVYTLHMGMKFSTPDGTIITDKALSKEARQCYVKSLKVTPYSLKTVAERETQTKKLEPSSAECNNVAGEGEQQPRSDVSMDREEVDLDPRAKFEEGRPTFDEPMTTVQLGTDSCQVNHLGLRAPRLVRDKLVRVIVKNSNLFAWSPADMPEIDPDFMCHKLALLPIAAPISQQKRKLGEERQAAVEVEVAQLASAGFIRELIYTTWLANVVMVKKSNGK